MWSLVPILKQQFNELLNGKSQTNKNQKLLLFLHGIKNEIEALNVVKKSEYGQDFMKIKFNTDDNLPLNKPVKLHLLTIIVRCIFEDGKFYPQLYLDDCLYELRVASNI